MAWRSSGDGATVAASGHALTCKQATARDSALACEINHLSGRSAPGALSDRRAVVAHTAFCPSRGRRAHCFGCEVDPPIAIQKHMLLCLCVDGPARAGEKGTPCASAGPLVRRQVGGCPRNCQRLVAGPSALFRPGMRRVTEPRVREDGAGDERRQVHSCRCLKAASQETCRRRTNQRCRAGCTGSRR